MAAKGTRKLTGTLKVKSFDYILDTEEGEFCLLDMHYIYRRLIGQRVVVKGVETGMFMLRVKDITLAT